MVEWYGRFEALLETVYGLPFGEVSFWIVLAVSVACTMVFGWFCCNLLLGGKAGFLASLLGFLMILGVGAVVRIALELYVVGEVANASLAGMLPWIGLGAGIFLGTLTFGRLILGLSEGKALLGVILTLAATSVATYMTYELVATTEKGLEQIEEKTDERGLNPILEE